MNHDDAIKGLFAERYFLDELTADELEAYEEHFFSCRTCALQVQALSDSIDQSKDIFAAQELEALGVVLFCPGHPRFDGAVTEIASGQEISLYMAAMMDISVVLKNASQKTIIGYSVNWRYGVDGGSTVRGVTYLDLDSLLDDGCVKQGTASDGRRPLSLTPGSARLV